MAETYSVKAVLSAYDKGFTAAMKNATRATDTLGSKIKSGLSFGALAGVGQQAFSSLCNGARELIGEISESNAAWKTFSGNMSMLGKNGKEIEGVKKEMQKFAEETIYSSSEMATTYAQLAAVGTKNCTKLVKGFGGLASAAENPQQAMKTLSMQATQMAAKPKIAWQDFKLMLEQTPAGIAAIAREMGMTTSELVTAVQDGTVETDKFFDAIAKVGTNDAFTKLATDYKTVGQAMDGLKETVGNKLTPAFDKLSQKAIKGISKVIDTISNINLDSVLKRAQPYVDMLASGFSALGKVLKVVGKGLKTVGNFLLDHSKIISKLIPVVLGVVGAFKAFSFLKGFNPFGIFAKNAEEPLDTVTQKTSSTANIIRQVFSGLSRVITSVGQAASVAAQGIGGGLATAFKGLGMALKLASPVVILAIGAAISMVAATFSVFSDAGKPLAMVIKSIGTAFSNLSPLVKEIGNAFSIASNAIGSAASKIITAFSTLIKAVSSVVNSLANGVQSIGTAIKTSFEGIASVLQGVGYAIAEVLNAISGVIKSVGQSAMMAGQGFLFLAQGVKTIVSTNLADLAASLTAVAVGIGRITAKGVGITNMANSMQTLSIGLNLLSVSAVDAIGGMNRLGASAKRASNSFSNMGSSTRKAMDSVVSGTSKAKGSMRGIQSATRAVGVGFTSMAAKARLAIAKIIVAMSSTASKARATGVKLGKGFTAGMKSGLNTGIVAAKLSVARVISALRSGRYKARSAGAYISLGFASGMRSQLGAIRSAAAQMAAAADKAVRAKAKIHSPSRVSAQLGQYWGEGFKNGMLDMVGSIKKASQRLINIPAISAPGLSLAYEGGMVGDYEYYRNSNYTIVVPVEIDGREVAKVTAPYTEEELNKRQARENRKKGRL